MSLHGPAYMGLVRERAAAMNNIQQMLATTESDVNELTVQHLAVRREILDGYWHRFQEAQRSLLVAYSHIEDIITSMSEIEYRTQALYAAAKAKLMHQHSQLPVEQPRPRAPRASEIKVDTFSGKYTEWAVWRSQFQAKVLNANIDVADKISLLTGALTKEAATCAGRAERLDDVELDRIWSKLDRTYDNRYQQVYAHIAETTGIAPMTHPSADKLRSIIDIVDQHLRMLKRFDIDTDHWSPIVCVLLLGKLDVDTRNQWESKDSLPTMPDLHALFAYLEQRILAIRNVEMSARRIQNVSTLPTNGNAGKSVKMHPTAKDNRFQPYERKSPSAPQRTSNDVRATVPSTAPECLQCGNGVRHYLWKCDTFRQLQLQAKQQQLAKWGICEVCLIAKHKATECGKGTCPICKNGRHNSLMCPEDAPKKVNQLRRRSKARSSSNNE